jgi:hypothetical protein
MTLIPAPSKNPYTAGAKYSGNLEDIKTSNPKIAKIKKVTIKRADQGEDSAALAL